MDAATPTPYGKYELLERIATGGMAELFLARSFGVAGFEKRLVIKRIRPELAVDARFVSMFINEAKISVHLNHPNVVQTYDLGRVGNSYYIAMEHLHGRDLNKLVKALRAMDERMPLPLSVRVVAECARGLAYAHARTDAEGQLLGLVHRDVSPHNLCITFAGEVKLVDFGIARLMNTAQGKKANGEPGRPGGGKYAYMSPEQAWGTPADHRTDIFSTGIVLWELIVGHRLYQDPDPAEKLRRVREATIPDPRSEGIEIDDELWRILRKALAREPENRYADARIFEEDLRAWLYNHNAQMGRPELSLLMRRAFPHDAEPSTDGLDLRRMVADVERLDAADRTSSSLTGSGSTPLPGRLMPSEGQRRRVAALIVDVDGLTELSARVEPEDLFKRHYQLLRWTRSIVDRHGGVVQRSVDDQVLILFGAERTREDDLLRALDCSLELQRRVNELHAKGLSVNLAIGVHGGEVTVGSRAGRQVRYVARGDTTRLARRLSSIADHGQILASEAVLRSAEGDFRFRRGPQLHARGGKAGPPSYQLQRRRQGAPNQSRGPWVRRGPEVDALRDAVRTLAMGRGSAVVVVGEVGSGKSRLITEIVDLARRRGLPAFVSGCTPFGEDPSMSPFRSLVRGILGVAGEATAEELLAQLPRLSQLGLTEREIRGVGSLLGVSRPVPGAVLDVWYALRHLLVGLTSERPAIVVFEDLHHLDERVRHRLCGLVRATAESPILYLMTHRLPAPRDLADIGEQVMLGPFGAVEQRRLLAYLLEAQEVSDALWALVDRTCEGNPLYIEEMVKYLTHHDLVTFHHGSADLAANAKVDALPPTLTALVTARIDTLAAAARGTLQLAAIIGMEFDAKVLGEAAGVEDTTPMVTDLASHGLVQRSDPGGLTWRFASQLVREAALRGILGIQRRDYHRMVAAAIETVYGDDRAAWLETLAVHCGLGGRLLDAARYAHMHGESLERRHQLERARTMYMRGLSWVREIPDRMEEWDARVQGEATLLVKLGGVEQLLGNTADAMRSLQLALDIASESGLPWIEARAHLQLGRAYMHRGRHTLAAAHLDQAQAIDQVGDTDPEVSLAIVQAAAYLAHERGENDKAESLWNRALAMAEDDAAAAAHCLLGLSNRLLRLGEDQRAVPLLEQALETAQRASDRILQGRILNNLGLALAAANNHDTAIHHFRQALEVREGIGYSRGVVVNHHNIGDSHFRMGDYGRAHVAFSRSRELAERMGWERGIVLNEVYLGYLDAQTGDETGLKRIEAATRRARELGDAEIATAGGWLGGRRLQEMGERDHSLERLREALDEAKRYDLRPMVQRLTSLLEEQGPPLADPQD